jgi:hypothetical protein
MASDMIPFEDQVLSVAAYGGGTFNSVAGNSYNSHMHGNYILSGCTVFLSGHEQTPYTGLLVPLAIGGPGPVVRSSTNRRKGMRTRPYPSKKP